MFDIKAYYRELNDKVMDSYQTTISQIREIHQEAEALSQGTEKAAYFRFFRKTADLILKYCAFEEKLNEDYFCSKSLEELLAEREFFYEEIRGENYLTSYANPTFAVDVFGDQIGQLMSYFYCRYMLYGSHVLLHKIFKLEMFNRLFIDVYACLKNDSLQYDVLRELISRFYKGQKKTELIYDLKERYDPEFQYYTDIVINSDLTDLRYLLKYNTNLSDTEITLARFLANFPEKKLREIAAIIVKAYRDGFLKEGKDLSKKTTVNIIFNVGQERLIHYLLQVLPEYNLSGLIWWIKSTKANKQFDYDHKFDYALFFDEEFTTLQLEKYELAYEACQDVTIQCSGDIVFNPDDFGDLPFTPQPKKERLEFSEEQQMLIHSFMTSLHNLHEKYLSRKETNFTAITFPLPSIGPDFEEIFNDIFEVNALDPVKYECIQHNIIGALDRGNRVHVKGKGRNKTDLTVQLQPINNPERETNFVNSGVDVNIPVGEVFTTPQLKGTQGVLHIEEIFLARLKYIDLTLHFEDGYISDYTCHNFDDEDANRKYIEQNLLFPHKTLPLGEFAIGTNTLAYVISRKHNILNELPPLISEKMAPHFAIGDTCFSHQEEVHFVNLLDHKEVTAKENEKTATRNTNPQDAYTHCHTDLILPYNSIDYLAVITAQGEKTDIIRSGRFVLDGTELLNEPFEMLK
ncbi:aminopeptidase [candidate division CSSED10-310 bacterium]|uniref:Aminopeptidase n=1 Tax=candidate division CSSED10-310 bacterium TaxID=2855610 RepID=A0ABV6Z5W0_UNCC1